MKITTESVGERELALTIKVDQERVRQAQRRTARHISREVEIPGFRRGKAPFDVVEQRLGAEVVRQELVNLIAEDVYRGALEQEDVVPYAPGTLEEVAFDPLTLKFVVPLAPTVELGDYRNYRREFQGPEVTEEAVEEALQGIREQNAVLNPLDRPAGEGEMVVGHLVGRSSDGQVFLHEEDAQVVLEPGEEEPIPGLADALVGLEPDEERTFTLALPEDFEVEELQGDKAEFSIEVDGVYERILPGLDDDLARTVGKYDSLEELTEHVRERLHANRRAEAESDYAEQVLQDIIAGAEVAYPPVMLEETLDDMIESFEARIERRERMMLEDYLRIQGKTMDDLREEFAPDAERFLERSLVLGEVVEQEGLQVSDVELDIQIAESSEQYGDRAEDVHAALSEPEAKRGVRSRMLANKAVQRLIAIAKGEAPEVGDEETEGDTDEK